MRTALGQRVLRELAIPRRLRPTDAAEEIDLLRVLAMALTAAAGKMLPLEQVQEAFNERSQMMVRSDFVEVYLGQGKSVLEEIEALIWLAENITGAANKRQALSVAAEIAARAYGLKASTVLNALVRREAQGSTGIGHGVATPHARLRDLDRMCGLFLRLETLRHPRPVAASVRCRRHHGAGHPLGPTQRGLSEGFVSLPQPCELLLERFVHRATATLRAAA